MHIPFRISRLRTCYSVYVYVFFSFLLLFLPLMLFFAYDLYQRVELFSVMLLLFF